MKHDLSKFFVIAVALALTPPMPANALASNGSRTITVYPVTEALVVGRMDQM